MNRSMEQVSGLHVDEIKPNSHDALGEMGIWVKFCRWSSGRLTQRLHVFSSFAWWTKKSSCPWSDGTWSYLDQKKGSFFSFQTWVLNLLSHLEQPRRAQSLPVFYSLWSMCKHALPPRVSVSLHFSELMKLTENTLVSILCGSLLFPMAACVHDLHTLLLTHINSAKDVNYRSSNLPWKPFFLLPGLFVPTSSLCLAAGLCAKYVLFVLKAAWFCLHPNESSRCATETNRADWTDALLEETDE